jgi:signal transduction histidine kinase
VENIRANAEVITFGNLSSRLPVAATGDALEHLSVTLNQMLKRLEDAYQQASRFSADASHELRTPLTIMRTELESIVREAKLEDGLHERVSSVLEEAEYLSRITESLFAISRLDTGEAKMESKLLDLADIVSSTAEQMSLLAEEKQLDMEIAAIRPVPVEGDQARLKQIVVNLLDNAIKYTPRGGKIHVRVIAAPPKAVLEIRDNGAGIAEAALPHVFERFYRADKMRSRDVGGAGLGLSIVRSITQAHGGTVDIQSTEGHGTKVTIELPLQQEK